jgi:acyl carrier protein
VKQVYEIEQWLAAQLSSYLGVPIEEIDSDAPFERYGLDSRVALELTGDLAEWLECSVPPTVFWEYPTIARLCPELARLATGASEAR